MTLRALEGKTVVTATRRRSGGHSGRSLRVTFTIVFDDGQRLVLVDDEPFRTNFRVLPAKRPPAPRAGGDRG